MGLRINTNVMSINAQRNTAQVNDRLAINFRRLATGLRVSSAADDAAGLAISERLRSQVRSLDQAKRNANDGISLVQTAEGSLNEVNSILVRLRELAVQASNGSVSNQDKETLDEEFQSLVNEVNRIGRSTEFNGIKLLDGTAQTLEVQVGIGTDATTSAVSIDLTQAMSSSALDLTHGALVITGTNGDAARAAIGQITAATGVVSSMRANFGAAQNRFETSIRNIGMTAENLAAANSRIRDVDVALETSNMTSLQILQQAGVSILAQANMTSQLALNLLQG